MNVGELIVSMTANTSDFEKSMAKVQTSLDKIGKGFDKAGAALTKGVTVPLLAAGAGMLALAANASQAADRLLDLSDITGMSTDSLQEWAHVARIAGVNTEAVAHATEGLVRRLPQIANEGGVAVEALTALGVSVYDASGAMKSGDDIMNELITSLASMEDPLQRNAYGSALFGGAWKDIAPILSLGAEGIADARNEAQSLGLVMSGDALNAANDFRIEMERMKAQAGALFAELGANLAPLLSDVLVPIMQDHVIPAVSTVVGWITQAVEWFKALDPEVQKNILAAVGFAIALGPILKLVGGLIGLVSTLGTVFAFLVSPVGLAVVAIGLAIAAGVLLYKNWDKISAVAKTVWAGVVKTVENAVNGVINAINAMIRLANKVPGINIPETGNVSFGSKSVGGTASTQGNSAPAVGSIARLATGTNYVPQDMLAFLHEGEQVTPKAYNPALAGGGDMQVVVTLDSREIGRAVAPRTVEMLRVSTAVR